MDKNEVWKADEDGEDDADVGEKNWDEHWQEYPPRSGKGRFVYQHHWRGLGEDETTLDESALLEAKHSVHGDLRLESDDGRAWGFTVFTGGPDRLIEADKDGKVQAVPKGEHSAKWLDAGAREPMVLKPGASGATTNTYSKLFRIDSGTYSIGVIKNHAIEIFIDGEKLKGRYLVIRAPLTGRPVWLIDKPIDQTPTAESTTLTDTIGELRGKKQRYLIWAQPGKQPHFFDVRTGRETEIKIAKADPVKKIIYGIVLDPYGDSGPKADAHDDWVPPAEVEKTAHGYMVESRVIGLQHKGKTNAKVVESWLEPYPPGQYRKAMANQDHRVYCRAFGDDVLHSVAWVLGVQLDDDGWKIFEKGEINAFSPGGYGVRQKMKKSDMPKVDFVQLVEARS